MNEYWYEVDRLTWQCRQDAVRRGDLDVAYAYTGLSFIAGHIWRMEVFGFDLAAQFIRDLAEFRQRLRGVEGTLLVGR